MGISNGAEMSIGNSYKILKNLEEPNRKKKSYFEIRKLLPTLGWSAKEEENA